MFIGTGVGVISLPFRGQRQQMNGYKYVEFHPIPQDASLPSPIAYGYLLFPWIATTLIVRQQKQFQNSCMHITGTNLLGGLQEFSVMFEMQQFLQLLKKLVSQISSFFQSHNLGKLRDFPKAYTVNRYMSKGYKVKIKLPNYIAAIQKRQKTVFSLRYFHI